MATEKNLSNLVINKVENQAVYEQMKLKNLINSDELYFVSGADDNATETTDGLMSAEDKIKLDGIEEGAEANVQSDWNITNTSSDAYIKNKPAALPANGGNAATVNGHTVETNVPANAVFTDTTYEKATQNKSGLMSASDKLKLDNIDENANYITVDSSLNSNSTNPVQNKIIKQAIDQRAPLSHTHTVSEVTDIAQVAKTGSYNDLTNKPTIPTKVSQLINDKSYVQQSQLPTKLSAFENDSGFIDTTADNLVNYYTKTNTYSKTEVNNLINTIPTMSIKIVDSLPETGSSKYIYLVSAAATENNNYYNEFLWAGSAYEMIGSTKVNLDGYLTNTGDSSNTSTQFTMAESRVLPQSGEILSVIFGKVVKYLNDLHSIAFSGSFNDLQDLNGKGLSTNDYTTEEKNKLADITKPLTYDYMPEGYPSKSIGTVTLMEQQELAFSDMDGTYGATSPVKIDISDGQTYTIFWDGAEYSCAGHVIKGVGYIGNPAGLGLESTSEPFLYLNANSQSMWASYDTSTSHTIKVTTIRTVYQTMDENFLPQPPRQVRNLDIHKSYSTEEIEEIYQSARDGAAIYLIYGDVITGISYSLNDSFTYVLPSGQEETIRPVDGVWNFANRETTYPSQIIFDSVYYDYAYIACNYNGVGGFDHQGYELIGTNLAGFNGDYIQAGHSIVLKLRDAPYYLYISATTNGEIEIEKRSSGQASGGETTTLFKNGDRSMILKSSTEGSTKKFKITVEDSGAIKTTNTIDNTETQLALISDIPTALSNLSDDEAHRTVSDTEKTTWNSKVDKVNGKGLSTNDYTTAEKQKLANIANGANNYTLPVATSSTLGGIKSGTDITIDASGNVSINDDSHNHIIGNVDGLQNTLNGKVDKVEGKQLSTNDFTNDYKTKLDGLSNPVAITAAQIDAICNATIYAASEVSV